MPENPAVIDQVPAPVPSGGVDCIPTEFPAVDATTGTDATEENDTVTDDTACAEAGGGIAPPPPTPAPAPKSTSGKVVSREILGVYYSRLYPFEWMHEWMSYGAAPGAGAAAAWPAFSHREWSFTIETDSREEIYLRFQSFKDAAGLREAVVRRRPIKIDVGAVYSFPPGDKKAHPSGSLRPVGRELVFDIDLTDYDVVRTCCSGADICRKCWRYMAWAMEIIGRGLSQDFGFRHLQWFYSGRRGVHCWVCDAEARALTDEGRSAVAQYFLLDVCSDKKKTFALELTAPLHPALQRAYDYLEPKFVKFVLPESGQGLLATKKRWMKFLLEMPDAASGPANDLMKKWEKRDSTPAEKWVDVTASVDALLGKKGPRGAKSKAPRKNNLGPADRRELEAWRVSTVLKHSYPRIDVAVSKSRGHLLKSPFCIHPKTGRVCVPIGEGEAEVFDPMEVPTLNKLVEELDACCDEGKEDWEKTSLRSCYRKFQEEFLRPLKAEAKGTMAD